MSQPSRSEFPTPDAGVSSAGTPADSPLFAPLTIGDLALRNRIVMSPMTREFSPGGVPGPDVAAYYRRRAAGGTGLLITEGVAIPHPCAVDAETVPRMSGQAALAGWARVVKEVHAAGGRIIPQLWHQGPMWKPAVSAHPHLREMRPSGVWGPKEGTRSLDPDYVAAALAPGPSMSEADIEAVIEAYASAARAAMRIGFDGIAIHGAHGYLIDAFLWDKTNTRADRWGGDRRGRASFGAAVVKAIRAEIGPGKPIFFRFSQWKLQDYKARIAETPEELGQLLEPLVDAGVDVFDGSQRYFDTPAFEGSHLNLAGWAKKLTGKLAMTVGGVGLAAGITGSDARGTGGAAGVNNLDKLVRRLENAELDLVGVGRSLLNDPSWSLKARSGEPFLPYDPENRKVLR